MQVTYQTLVTAGLKAGTAVDNVAEVDTETSQDSEDKNTDDSKTKIPFPDMTTTVTGSPTVIPGESTSYTINYQNTARTCAKDAYIVHRLPDAVPQTPDGRADMKITHISANTGTIYYHDTLDVRDFSAVGTGDYPAFDPTDPTTGGWKLYTAGSQPIQAIAVHYGSPSVGTGTELCQSDGTQRVTVYTQARDPQTGAVMPIGYEMPSYTLVSNTNGEENRSNNTATHTITTPSIDLQTTITGSSQGAHPGIVP